MKISTIEKELDVIRIRHYEQTKDMTPDERIAYIRTSIAPIMQQYNFRTATQVASDSSDESIPTVRV
jgi:hypothetical protein